MDYKTQLVSPAILIRYIVIYPVDFAIKRLNNRRGQNVHVKSCQLKHSC